MSDVGRIRSVGLVVALAVVLPILAVGGFAAYLKVSGTPLVDEWACSRGERPYVYAEGGAGCATSTSTPPSGAHWDPLGNRPLVCDHRWGWTRVERTGATDETGCLRNGRPVPDGWRVVDQS